jgi:hypothetical protein
LTNIKSFRNSYQMHSVQIFEGDIQDNINIYYYQYNIYKKISVKHLSYVVGSKVMRESTKSINQSLFQLEPRTRGFDSDMKVYTMIKKIAKSLVCY